MNEKLNENIIKNKIDNLKNEEWNSDSDVENNNIKENKNSSKSKNKIENKQTKDFIDVKRNYVLLKPTTESQNSNDTINENNNNNNNNEKSAVVYLGRIPHGFYEKEMLSFFSQFGPIKRLKISRNKKTGKSKHYAFIEFTNKEIATIVAETMNQYRLYDHVIQSHVVLQKDIHKDLFKNTNKKFKVKPYKYIFRQNYNKKKDIPRIIKCIKKKEDKENKRRAILNQMGINYEFDEYQKQLSNISLNNKNLNNNNNNNKEGNIKINKSIKERNTDEITSEKK